MPIANTRLLMVLAIMPMLGGCQSVFMQSLLGHRNRASDPAIEMASAVPADAATQEGRQQLASGNPGLAIASLERALATGESIAPAANALGVAYARVGRPDLAQRYFEQAIASAPNDPKYAANLDRLVTANQLEFAYRQAAATAKLAAVSQSAAQKVAQRRVDSSATGTSLAVNQPMRRVSRAEVMITTASPVSGARLGKMAEANPGFTPVVRLNIGRDKIADFHPVVRLELPSGDGKVQTSARGGQPDS